MRLTELPMDRLAGGVANFDRDRAVGNNKSGRVVVISR